MILLTSEKTIQNLLLDEKYLVESYYNETELLDISGFFRSDISLSAIEFELVHGSTVILATSDTHRYVFEVQEDASIAFVNGEVMYTVNAYPIGHTNGALVHQGLRVTDNVKLLAA